MIETAPRPTIRTLVASFVFTDLVGFSKGTASDQYAAKARFSSVLRTNLAPLQESDYWIKDTGDGALIAFVSNPEHALYMALALAHEYPAPIDSAPSNSLRTGLHLGTVKESIDVEARRNFIGDGINAAKRIMDFAQPGQIAASRAFYEAIANLDAAYAALFEHLGAPDDKHGRAHDLYALAPSEMVLARLRADLAAERAGSAADAAVRDANGAARGPSSGGTKAPNARRGLVVASAAALAIAALFVAMRAREPAPAMPPMPAPSAEPAREPGAIASVRKNERPAQPDSAPPGATQFAPSSQGAGTTPKSSTELPASPPKPETATRAALSAAPAKASEAKLKSPASSAAVTDTRGASAASSPRCSRIVEKAALGEPLTPEEKKELANTCH